MTTFGQFENQSQRVHESSADALAQIGQALELGLIGADLVTELNLTSSRLTSLIDFSRALQSQDTLTNVYSASLDGDFDNPQIGVSAAEFAASQIVANDLADELVDFLDPRVLQQAGVSEAEFRGLAEVVAGETVQTLIDSAQATFSQLVQLGNLAIEANSGSELARAGYAAQQLLMNRLAEFRENAITDEGYLPLIDATVILNRVFATQAIETEGANIFSIFGGAERVADEVSSAFSTNGQRAIIELSVLSDAGLSFQDPELGPIDPIVGYAQGFVNRQTLLNEDYAGSLIIDAIPTFIASSTALVIAELSPGFSRVTTNDQASIFVLGIDDEGVGSDFADIMLGGTELRGREGDDFLAADQQSAGATIIGGMGNDTILGTLSDDMELSGGADNDTILGFGGNDIITGGSGMDSLDGGDGNDNLSGGSGDDFITGGNGMDVLNGGNGMDELSGDGDSDILNGGGGRDQLDGGLGDDMLNGGSGQDTIFGGDGNDVIDGGEGRDFINGGDGEDTIILSDGRDIIDGGDGFDSLIGGALDGLIVAFEGRGDSNPDSTSGNVQLIDFQRIVGTSGQDQILQWSPDGPATDSDGNFVEGGYVFEGLGGADTLSVGNGEFTFIGGTGADTVIIDRSVSSGFTTVTFADAEAVDEAFFDATNVAATITSNDVDPFEAWADFTNAEGETDWEFTFFDDVNQINYRYLVSTGELTINQGGDRYIIPGFENGDLGISLPDNPIGPGVGGSSPSPQNNGPNQLIVQDSDFFVSREYIAPDQSDFLIEPAMMEETNLVAADDWLLVA